MREGYKDSALGEIPVEWEVMKLSELATFRRGSFPQPYGLDKWYDDENGFPFVQVFDVGDDMKLKNDTKRKISKEATELSVFVPKGALILTIQGSIGRIAITHYDTYLDRTLLVFQSFLKPIDKPYFMYVVHRLFEFEKEKAHGSTIKTITKEQLSSFTVTLPLLPEQQKIAQILTTVDEKIDLINQQFTETTELKKGLMQKLLTKGIGHSKFKDSALGEIPESWEVDKLSKLLSKKNAIKTGPFGSSITKSMYVEKGFKVYGQEQVIAGDINVGDYYIDKTKFENLNQFHIKAGDLLISLVGTLGRVLQIGESFIPGIINPRLLKISPDVEKFYPAFLRYSLLSHYVQDQMTKMSTGGTMSIINATIVKSITVLCPPLSEQHQIATILTTVDDKLDVLKDKKAEYQALKKGLMQQLLTGKVRVCVT